MKHGAFSMIPKANDKVCNGNSRHPHDPRKLACRNHKWRQCSSLSSISSVTSTLNLFHNAKQLMKLIMWKYWNCYVKPCEGKCLNFDATIGFSTPWQCYSSQDAPCQVVSCPKIYYWNEHAHYSLYLAPSCFWLFPKIKSALYGRIFQNIEDNRKK